MSAGRLRSQPNPERNGASPPPPQRQHTLTSHSQLGEGITDQPRQHSNACRRQEREQQRAIRPRLQHPAAPFPHPSVRSPGFWRGDTLPGPCSSSDRGTRPFDERPWGGQQRSFDGCPHPYDPRASGGLARLDSSGARQLWPDLRTGEPRNCSRPSPVPTAPSEKPRVVSLHPPTLHCCCKTDRALSCIMPVNGVVAAVPVRQRKLNCRQRPLQSACPHGVASGPTAPCAQTCHGTDTGRMTTEPGASTLNSRPAPGIVLTTSVPSANHPRRHRVRRPMTAGRVRPSEMGSARQQTGGGLRTGRRQRRCAGPTT